MNKWNDSAVFYHIYPLGFCGAPRKNDFSIPPVSRIRKLLDIGGYLKETGFNALYLGPLFESSAHGYDTADYFRTDRRLGTDEDLAEVCASLKKNGLRIIFDAVFNHVGRDFFAFRDLRQKCRGSEFREWFDGLDFTRQNGSGDPFSYSTWGGDHNLIKLNLKSPAVREYLFGAAAYWIKKYDIDGLRLDAADCMDKEFLGALAARCRGIKKDFWLMGEVVRGNYRDWANPSCIDSVTNYEAYKGLYSSFNTDNFFEIAWTLNRLSGPEGLCRGTNLYSFADNHDVDRIAGKLKDIRHLHPLYCLLFCMPGIPSVYYGSEFGIKGAKGKDTDAALRPEIDLPAMLESGKGGELRETISKLAALRSKSPALQTGNYEQLYVAPKQIGFIRRTEGQVLAVFVNASSDKAEIKFDSRVFRGKRTRDLLNPGWEQRAGDFDTAVTVDGNWARILEIIR